MCGVYLLKQIGCSPRLQALLPDAGLDSLGSALQRPPYLWQAQDLMLSQPSAKPCPLWQQWPCHTRSQDDFVCVSQDDIEAIVIEG